MDSKQILRADYLDLLFEGRNKRYGGYVLRRNYSTRARTAILAVIAGVSLLIAGPVIASETGNTTALASPAVERAVTLSTPPPEPPKPLPVRLPDAPAQQVAMVRAPEFRLAPDVDVTEQPPKVDDLAGKQIGLQTTDGPLSSTPDLIGRPGDGSVLAQVDPPVDDRKEYTGQFVEQQPTFPGDLYEYLRKNLRYPEEAQEAGVTGRSVIQFVVNADGSIENVEVVRSSTRMLDEEALRVVRAMPRWKPGRQNGRAVRVQFAIPIAFQ